MSTPFQNRLVGTIIVAAVAIIILPDLLDGNKKTYQDEFEQIPPPPKVEFVKSTPSFPEDKIVINTDEILSDEAALDDDVSSTEQAIKDTSETESDPGLNNAVATKEDDKALTEQAVDNILPEKSVLQQAWVVQLGSFRHKKNVAQLLLKLKDNGYTAFTKPIKTKNGPLIKVFIGPELIKNSLIKKIPALKKLTGVEGKIARFYPTK
ncbi:SPOR domain-containing protein [Colwellia sp. BRX9-1]|uniref:SPOR domain-containing protein n=1 Tax=Colwellia sp. BRX9-1 TaxID=2759830 RepID=UPI0015F44E5D|nr:SPOR domain-containing protein [Colwellia sp. BRX9-1]MBA6351305.1 SPOR domain-containing protein [Colwellia sp. BRX9-1]